MHFQKLAAALCFFVLSHFTYGQVKTNFDNRERITSKGIFQQNYDPDFSFSLPAQNIQELIKRESENFKELGGEKPFFIASPTAIDLDMAKLMKWIQVGSYAYGKFNIIADGALSLSINFDNFYLPAGCEMYVYNKDGRIITGPVTSNENNLSKSWGSWVYGGDELVIEVKIPIGSISFLQMHSNNIAYGYKSIPQVGDFGESASCHINVICTQGNGWSEERNAVALVLTANGNALGSGSMIMNSCGTNTPYFLTAEHVRNASPTVSSWRFTFQAWSSACSPSQNATGTTFYGSSLRANWTGSDFCLLELDDTPPLNSGIRYAGWSRSTSITSTTILHHPRGDVMKLCIDNDSPGTQTFLGSDDWFLNIDVGATEPGSSGAPYFNQDHRIVGQHHGIDDGNLSDCDSKRKFGGRFHISWTGNGTNSTRLSNWLDEGGSNATTTNTTDIANLIDVSNITISGPAEICSTANYTINNQPSGTTVTWGVNSSTLVTHTGGSITRSGANSGYLTITATISGINCNNIVKELTVYVGNPADVSAVTVTQGVIHCHVFKYAYTVNSAGATSYQWESRTLPSGTFSTIPNTTGNTFNEFGSGNYPPTCDQYEYRVRSVNGCATGAWYYFYGDDCLPFDEEGCGGRLMLQASPNPATSELNLQLQGDNHLKDDERSIKAIRIVDDMGNVKMTVVGNFGKSTKIRIGQLQSGVHVVLIWTGKEWVSTKIIKQ